MVKRWYICCFSLFIQFHTFSHTLPVDTVKKSRSLGGKIQYGIILPHSERIRALAFNNPYGIELNINRLNYSEKSVQRLNCYSYSGIAFNYINFGHPKIGHNLNLWYYFEPIFQVEKPLGFGLRAGTGMSYLTEVYDINTNPENQFFASHFAFLLMLEFKAKYKLTEKLELTASLCYNHISNGGIKQPNYGMNFPTIGLGLDYHLNPIDLEPIEKKKISANEKIWQVLLEGMSSVKVQEKMESLPEKVCFIYGISGTANRRLGKFSSINAGFEFINDGYVRESNVRDGLDTDHKRIAAIIGHELIFGQVGFETNFGFYVYCPTRLKDFFYQKYSLRYAFGKRLKLGVFMLAHGDAADIMGLTLQLQLLRQSKP